MKGKVSKPATKKPVSRKSSVRKSVKKRKTEDIVLPVPIPLVFETPTKGFRPYETAPPEELSRDSLELKSPEQLDRLISPGKRQKTQEHQDIWTAGIENVTYVPSEFDFPSFPIQY